MDAVIIENPFEKVMEIFKDNNVYITKSIPVAQIPITKKQNIQFNTAFQPVFLLLIITKYFYVISP